ncbi:hypothetical protein VTK73DRAFT_6626 [Phialemonium thermophilum]|uniref:Extracellular serine-rich protein n=1 Tax=Phialemonium thermophilum TaxID=223376 RepID=A0ABR3XW88_9PEZI
MVLVSSVEAQAKRRTTTSTSNASTTSSSPAVTHSVAVGAEGFNYTPAEIKGVSVGDVIEFRFYPGGHTVVRAEYGYPCIPYELTGANKIGFFSGQKSPQVISNNLPTFQVRVNNTNPIFYYCSAPSSCIKNNMIGVINPSANETLQGQLEFIKNATLQLAPGESFPSETASPTSSNPSATGKPVTGSNNGGHKSGLSSGAIAGIAIGAAALTILAGTLIYLCGWRGAMGATSRPGLHMFGSSPSAMGPPVLPMTEATKFPSPTTPKTPVVPGLGPATDPYRSWSPSVHGASPVHILPRDSAYGQRSDIYAHTPPLGAGSAEQTHSYGDQPATHRTAGTTTVAELPGSSDPGNSPLPTYPGRFSWAQGQEAEYRPGGKP